MVSVGTKLSDICTCIDIVLDILQEEHMATVCTCCVVFPWPCPHALSNTEESLVSFLTCVTFRIERT